MNKEEKERYYVAFMQLDKHKLVELLLELYELQRDIEDKLNQHIIKEKDKHITTAVRCYLCNATWQAVAPYGVERLECPKCHNMIEY